jgi:hypothetical protein
LEERDESEKGDGGRRSWAVNQHRGEDQLAAFASEREKSTTRGKKGGHVDGERWRRGRESDESG